MNSTNEDAFPAALSIRSSLHLLASGDATPAELVSSSVSRANAVNPGLNAFATIATDQPLRDAVESARRWREGRARSLEGVPIAVKDLIDTAGLETRYGSAAYRGHIPETDAVIVRKLRDEGAIIIGKTTTHEFAWGVTTASTNYGDTRNPVDERRIPGGSSGGAAAAIKAGVVAAGLGTDTGGSVRIPAALCGTVGYKPTFGRLPTAGIFPFTPSLDHAGILGSSADDVILMARGLGVHAHEPDAPSRFKLGLIRGISPIPLESPVAHSFDLGIASLLDVHRVVEMDPTQIFEGVFQAFATIVLTEASVGHYARSSREEIETSYEPETRERLERARSVNLQDYFAAQDFRRSFISRLFQYMQDVDFLVLPTAPCAAPLRGQESITIKDWSGTVREALMTYVAPFNMTGFPAISLPLAVPPEELPCGLQIVARPGQDAVLLRFAEQTCQLNNYEQRR